MFKRSITKGAIAITRLSTAAVVQVVQPRFEPPATTKPSMFPERAVHFIGREPCLGSHLQDEGCKVLVGDRGDEVVVVIGIGSVDVVVESGGAAFGCSNRFCRST